MNDVKRPAGLILSAGFSSRMKEFKPLMKIGGRNLLEILIDNFRIAGIEDIFVVVGYNAALISEYLADKGVAIIMNKDFANGMFTSVKAGISAVRENGNECVLMTPVDIPLIPPYIMKAVLGEHKNDSGAFVVPCYKGKKGHPLCIPEKYFDEIIESNGKNGLKSITSQYENRFIKIDTHAGGIVLDMDTQEAYRGLLDFYNEHRYPDEEQCRKIIRRAQTPSHVVRHCEAVADTGVAIAEELNKHGRNLSIPLIRAAGMLHDVLRVEKKHWEAGARLLLDYGYPEVADIIDAHMNYIPAVPVYDVSEKDIVCLSDKLRQEETLVTLQDRLEPVRVRWKDNPEALHVIETKINAADAVVRYINEAIGGDIYEVLRERDRRRKEAESLLPRARRLILIRHGETQKHKGKIFLGQKDIPLNVEGKEQCTHVGLEMQHFDLQTDVVYTSNLNRAVESARIITRILGDSFSMVEVPEFREMNLGHWDGMYVSEVKERYPDEYKKRGADLVNYRIDDEAENFTDLQERVMKKLNELIETTSGDIVIVSHSGVLRVIKCAIENRPLSDIKKMKFDRGTYEVIELPHMMENS